MITLTAQAGRVSTMGSFASPVVLAAIFRNASSIPARYSPIERPYIAPTSTITYTYPMALLPMLAPSLPVAAVFVRLLFPLRVRDRVQEVPQHPLSFHQKVETISNSATP